MEEKMTNVITLRMYVEIKENMKYFNGRCQKNGRAVYCREAGLS